jgi:LPXTG-site transpeptidase (sortase) family protein
MKKRHATVGIALALIIAGGLLTFGPTLALNLWDAHLARLRDAQTARWMATHLRPAAVHVGSARRAAPAGLGVITPGRDGYLLEIPALNLRLVVHTLEPAALMGVPTPTLTRYGLGQIPYTAQLRNVSPGGNGTTAIAGHRTTHGAPFRHLDLLKPGDVILVRKGARVQQWRVTASAVIAPTDVDAIRSHAGAQRLVLLACTPPFSDQSRLMIVAEPAALAPVIATSTVPVTSASLSGTPALAQTPRPVSAVTRRRVAAAAQPSVSVQTVRSPSRSVDHRSSALHSRVADRKTPARAMVRTAARATPRAPARAFVPPPVLRGGVLRRDSRSGPLPSTFPAPYTNGSDVLWSTSDRQHERDSSGGSGDHQHEEGRR